MIHVIYTASSIVCLLGYDILEPILNES